MIATDDSETPDILLASRSPRRQALLEQIGVRFRLAPVDIDETRKPDESPGEMVCRLAKAKALTALDDTDLPVLGADTAVVVDGDTLGKPANREEALGMLRRLGGRSHQVLTAVTLATSERCESALSTSTVTFCTLTERDMEQYWDSGEPVDKAGAYAIQGAGARFVSHLSGSYSGVVGLPLFETANLLARFGIAP